MANFRAHSGLFVKVVEDGVKGLDKGSVLQIMGVSWGCLSFVGVNGSFRVTKELAKVLEPIYNNEEK